MGTDTQRRTFLSYSRVNSNFVVRLARELKAEGFPVFLDQLDIPTGTRWDVELEKALAECEIFLIIMTPASLASENVRDEIGYAIDNGKRFLPILLEPCTIPLRLRRFQYIDITKKSFDEGLEFTKDLLRGFLAQSTLPQGQIHDLQALAEAGRRVREKDEAERAAKQKAEEELAAQKLEKERAAKAEAERHAKKEEGSLSKQKVEGTPPAKAEEKQPAKARLTSTAEPKEDVLPAKAVPQKQLSKGLLGGIVALAVIIIAVLGSRAMAPKDAPTPTSTKAIAASTATKSPSTTVVNSPTPPKPTETQAPTPTATAIRLPAIKFVKNTNMDELFDVFSIGPGDVEVSKDIYTALSDDGLVPTLNAKYIYLYYMYKPYTYKDVGVRIEAQNLGSVTLNNISLICRKSGNTWYEYGVTSTGLWGLYTHSDTNPKSKYTLIGSGPTDAIKGGQFANVFEMQCIGKDITLIINGKKVKTVQNELFTEGQTGFNISTLDKFPVTVKVSKFEVFEP